MGGGIRQRTNIALCERDCGGWGGVAGGWEGGGAYELKSLPSEITGVRSETEFWGLCCVRGGVRPRVNGLPPAEVGPTPAPSIAGIDNVIDVA